MGLLALLTLPTMGDYFYVKISTHTAHQGKLQKITFPPVADMKPSSPPVTLQASADSGLPVEYYILSGPAVVCQFAWCCMRSAQL